MIFLLFLLLFSSSGCAADKPSLQTLLPETDSMVISEYWMGLSPVAPVSAGFVLKKTPTSFAGKATFLAGYDSTQKKDSVDMEIPNSVAQQFFKILANAQLSSGPYKPKIEHTDDYPHNEIELHIGKETILFWTQSQGPGFVPWGLKLAGKEYVINSDLPDKAIQLLDPYMHRDVQKKLNESVMSHGKP